MTVKTGITSSTPDKIIIDAGAVYLDYGLSTQTLLGATRGGNEFNLNRVTKNIEADGLKGAVKGMKRVTEVNPQITANLLELSVKNLIAAIAGANQSDRASINVEHVGVGAAAGATKKFSLDQDNVVVNSEKIYVQKSADGEMILQTRSKKYASRFVGTKADENRTFETGTGNWATGGTGTVAMKTDGQSGNCLEYTPGTDAKEDFLKILGADGAVIKNLVKDQYYRIQIAVKGDASWNGGAITVTCGGIATDLAIANPADPAATWKVYVAIFKATSNVEADIKLTAGTDPTAGLPFIDSVELERVDYPTDDEKTAGQIGYTMNWVEGEVYFADGPAENFDIIASYTYEIDTPGDHTVITGGEIGDTDYIDNVAIVGNVSGKTNPVICMVKNALADTGFSLATAPRDEAVPAIVFTGHYDPSDLDTEPWEIRWPNA